MCKLYGNLFEAADHEAAESAELLAESIFIFSIEFYWIMASQNTPSII